ncbi:DedA family protein [Geodermatophilus sp. TF02-6]|uniref:DedA family protein n=1 Tax=Geodermatophilus sp. TF02-6 TaxID=2250575 RepID=UPI000DE95AB2|nr:DedA family protein [Geodermatophilus sp. TF02-6]RBY78124.1 DedA family protein [Geodermatophilus sp. TF02-6]
MSLLAGLPTAVSALVGGAGWPGLAAVMAVEGVVPFVPSEVVLPLAGTQVAAGSLSFVAAVLGATAGSVVGAWLLHTLGRVGGRVLLTRLPRPLRVDEQHLARVEAWAARRGDAVVLFGRLVPGLRVLVSVPAGLARMPLARFTALTALGSLGWNAGLVWLGETLAGRWTEVSTVVSEASSGLLVTAAVVLPAARLWVRRRGRLAAAR